MALAFHYTTVHGKLHLVFIAPVLCPPDWLWGPTGHLLQLGNSFWVQKWILPIFGVWQVLCVVIFLVEVQPSFYQTFKVWLLSLSHSLNILSILRIVLKALVKVKTNRWLTFPVSHLKQELSPQRKSSWPGRMDPWDMEPCRVLMPVLSFLHIRKICKVISDLWTVVQLKGC